MSERLEELYAEKRSIYDQMQAMMKVDQENWTPEDEEKWNELDDDIKLRDTQIEGEEAAMARNARMQVLQAQADRQQFEDRSSRGEMQALREGRLPGLTRDQVRERGFAAWLNPARASRQDSFCAKQINLRMEQTEIDVQLFRPYAGFDGFQVPDGVDVLKRCREIVELRQQSTAPDGSGGETVPQGMMQAIEIALLQFGAPRQYSDIVRAGDGREMPWPTVNDTAQVGEIIGENTTANQQDATFGQATTKPFKYSSKYVPVSVELMQDSATNMNQLVGRLLGERIGRKQSTDFTVGAGTTEPEGIITGAADSGITLGAIDTVTYDELIDLKHSVDPAYRMQGHGYLLSDKILAAIKKVKSDDGMPIWKPSLAPDAPNLIDGDPYFINQSMPVGASAKCIAYGQLNKYKIHDALGMRLRRLTELHALLDQITFLAWLRSDGKLLDAGTNPVKYATNPAV